MAIMRPWSLTATDFVDRPIEYEQLYDVTISERDLLFIARCLKSQQMQERLRRKYPAVDEAWLNLMTIQNLMTDPFDDPPV